MTGTIRATKAILRVRTMAIPALRDQCAHEAEIIGKAEDPTFTLSAITRQRIEDAIRNTVNTMIVQNVQGSQVIETVRVNACAQVVVDADFVVEFSTTSIVDAVYDVIVQSPEWQHAFPIATDGNGARVVGVMTEQTKRTDPRPHMPPVLLLGGAFLLLLLFLWKR